jgi:hypothetical protein
MIPYLIAFVVGILGGWIHAGFPLPRRRRSSPAKSEAREIGESTVTGSAPHILRDGGARFTAAGVVHELHSHRRVWDKAPSSFGADPLTGTRCTSSRLPEQTAAAGPATPRTNVTRSWASAQAG